MPARAGWGSFAFAQSLTEECAQNNRDDQQGEDDASTFTDHIKHVANLCGERGIPPFQKIQGGVCTVSDRAQHPACDTKNERKENGYNYQCSQHDNLLSCLSQIYFRTSTLYYENRYFSIILHNFRR